MSKPPSLRSSGFSRGSVKGSVLQSRLHFVRSAYGDEGLARVLARLGEHDRSIVSGTLMSFAWYPFETNEHLDRAIADEVGKGNDTFLALGATSADDNLATASQLTYVREKNPHALLKHTSAIYKVYYDTGHRTYERVADGAAILRTFDSESFSREDCLTVVGWHKRAIEMCGGTNVRVRETQCRADGAPCCEYVCEWDT